MANFNDKIIELKDEKRVLNIPIEKIKGMNDNDLKEILIEMLIKIGELDNDVEILKKK